MFLHDPDNHPRVVRRTDHADEVAQAGAPTVRVEVQRARVASMRVLAQVLLGDLVSVYMAVLEDVDPTPIAAIERLKARLA